MDNNENQIKASTGNQTASAAPDQQSNRPAGNQRRQNPNQASGQRPNGQSNNGQARGGPLTEDEKNLLNSLIQQKLKNPGAARELLFALQRPGARFSAMTTGLGTRGFRVIQDTDRVLAHLDRSSNMKPERLDARHQAEKRVAEVLSNLAAVTAEIAQDGNVPAHMIQENAVRDAMKKASKKGDSEGAPAAELAQAA